MSFIFEALGVSLALLAGMLVLMEVGRRLGCARREAHPDARTQLGPVEGALFGLLGLVMALTFSGAAARYDARRMVIAQEANAIGTAYDRLDLLRPEEQPPLRDLCRRYLDARIAYYREAPDTPAHQAQARNVQQLLDRLWKETATACDRDPRGQVSILVVPAVNELANIVTTRAMTSQLHPPGVIYAMLFVLASSGALVAGYASAEERNRSWLHHLGFALIFSVTVYVVIDLEHPRLGFIRLQASDRVLEDLRTRIQGPGQVTAP